MNDDEIQVLARLLAAPVATRPDQLRITSREAGDSVFVEIGCAPEDVGLLIGREGEMARALQGLLTVAADSSVRLTIQEPADDRRVRPLLPSGRDLVKVAQEIAGAFSVRTEPVSWSQDRHVDLTVHLPSCWSMKKRTGFMDHFGSYCFILGRRNQQNIAVLR